jgi:hypothetical protein
VEVLAGDATDGGRDVTPELFPRNYRELLDDSAQHVREALSCLHELRETRRLDPASEVADWQARLTTIEGEMLRAITTKHAPVTQIQAPRRDEAP